MIFLLLAYAASILVTFFLFLAIGSLFPLWFGIALSVPFGLIVASSFVYVLREQEAYFDFPLSGASKGLDGENPVTAVRKNSSAKVSDLKAAQIDELGSGFDEYGIFSHVGQGISRPVPPGSGEGEIKAVESLEFHS